MITGPRMVLHIPEDPEFLQAVAKISISHSALDHALKMCIKTLADITVEEALAATSYEGSRMLRDRIRRLAKMRLGEGAPLLKLQALMRQCEVATERRNRLTHGVIAQLDDGQVRMQTTAETWERLPTPEALEELGEGILHLAMELNHQRLNGFLDMALKSKELPAGDSG